MFTVKSDTRKLCWIPESHIGHQKVILAESGPAGEYFSMLKITFDTFLMVKKNSPLGKGSTTKSDEFLEKILTALDPPLFFRKL